MGREWRIADGCRDAQECRGKGKFSGSRVWTWISVQSAARAEAAFTCSEDETIAKGFSLSQGPTSASSSTSSTVMPGLHTPWSHSPSFWLPLFVDAGAGSCRLCVGGSTTGVVDAGLLLLVEMGQSMPLSFSGGTIKRVLPTQRGCFSIWSTASSAPPESSPILAHIGPIGQGATQAARFLDRTVVLPERQHENGNEDADDADDAQGGLLRLVVEMGKSGLTAQGNSHAGLRAAQTAAPECTVRGPGASGGHIGFA
eukprot:scaffold6568_cov60-Phaeocystis_antarctica.AAC.4